MDRLAHGFRCQRLSRLQDVASVRLFDALQRVAVGKAIHAITAPPKVRLIGWRRLHRLAELTGSRRVITLVVSLVLVPMTLPIAQQQGKLIAAQTISLHA